MSWRSLNIILIILWSTTASAQILSRTIKTSQFTETSSVAVQDSFIFLNKSHNFSFGYRSSAEWLLKLDMQLNSVDSVNLSNLVGFVPGSNDRIFCERMLFVEMDVLTVLITTNKHFTDTNGNPSLLNRSFLLEFDTDLNVLQNVHIDIDSISPRFLTVFNSGSGKILVGDAFMEQGFRPLLVKTDDSGNVIFTRLYNKPGNSFDGSIHSVIGKGQSSYYLGIEDQANSPAGSEILVVDSNFYVTDTIQTYYSAPFYPRFYSFELVKDDLGRDRIVGYHFEYLDTIPSPIRTHLQLGFAEIDSNNELENIKKHPLSGFEAANDNGSIFGLKFISENTDFTNADSILVVATGHYVGATNDYMDQWPNALYIYNYNLNTDTMNWMRVFDNGYVNNSYTLARRLPGNRYLVGRNEYNWDKYQGPNLAIVLMILNENGDIISQREIPVGGAAFSAYPNPFEDEVRLAGLDINQNYNFQLMSVSGKEVESGKVENGRIVFDEVHSGIFVLELHSDGKSVGATIVKGK